jgi:MFS family permease
MGRMAVLFYRRPGTRLNPIKGSYTALAIFLPFIVLATLGHAALGGVAMIGALLTAFTDIDIPNLRTRASILGLAAVGGAVMTILGRLGHGPWWFQELEVFLVVLISGLLAAYSSNIAALGLLLTLTFVISLSSGRDASTALSAGGGYLLGGAILTLLALGFALLSSKQHPLSDNVQPTHNPQPPSPQLALTWPLLIYSLLRAIGTAGAIAISLFLGGTFPFWATLPVIICSNQDRDTSRTLALQYVVATFLGALLAGALVILVQPLSVIVLIIIVVTFLAFTMKDLNYTFQIFFLTVLTLLLISLVGTGQSFATWRVIAILIGVGIVLIMLALNQTLLRIFHK